MAIVLIALAIFVAGGIAGGYILIIIGIRNEDRRRTMLYRWAPDQSSRAARSITGLWARQSIDGEPVPDHWENLPV